MKASDVAPATSAFFRCFYAIPVLWLLARGAPRDARQRRLAYAAGVLFAVDLVAWHYSIAYIGAGLATVLGNLQVVLVGLTAWLVLAERPEARVLIAVPPAFIGIVLISGVGWIYFKQSLDLPAMLGIALIVAGVLIVNVFSQTAGH